MNHKGVSMASSAKRVPERFCVVDVETSGLHPNQGSRMVSVAIVSVDRGQVVQRAHLAIAGSGGLGYYGDAAPDVPRSERAVVAGWLRDSMAWADAVVAHNAPFDETFLRDELSTAGIAWPDTPVVCTMRLAQRLELDTPNWSLVACANAVGVPCTEVHRADADAEAAAGLFLALLERARAQNITTLGELTAASAGASGGGGHGGGHSLTFEIDLFADLEVRDGETRWEAISRSVDERQAADRAAWQTLEVVHQQAHLAWQALGLSPTEDDYRLVLEQFLTARCPETPEHWSTMVYAIGDRSPKKSLSLALDGLDRCQTAGIGDRASLARLVWSVNEACDRLKSGPETLLTSYEKYGAWLARMPACPDCAASNENCRDADLGWSLDMQFSPTMFNATNEKELAAATAHTEQAMALLRPLQPQHWAGLATRYTNFREKAHGPESCVELWIELVASGHATVDTYDRYSLFLERAGRHDEAIILAERGVEADQTSQWSSPTVSTRLTKRATRCRKRRDKQ